MIALAPADALALPVDELAMTVLADWAHLGLNMQNEGNYLRSYYHDQHGTGYGNNAAAQRVIAEATGWLRAHGMIARDLNKGSDSAIFVTRWGHEALTKKISEIRAINRLQANLHPLIEQKARRQFLLGEYETAIFVSMKAVEVRVRKLAGFGDDMVGRDMIQRALNKNGPLADTSAPSGEVDSTMMLFSGAYGVLRNPSGHREVSFDDVTEAAEAVQTASLLMRMLDRIESRLKTGGQGI
ncbi:TIGR02391 family protein [Actinosynnema sp. CA-248983]